MTAEHSAYEELARDRRGSEGHRQGYAEARRAFLIGQAVRERRLALGLSQVELAAVLAPSSADRAVLDAVVAQAVGENAVGVQCHLVGQHDTVGSGPWSGLGLTGNVGSAPRIMTGPSPATTRGHKPGAQTGSHPAMTGGRTARFRAP